MSFSFTTASTNKSTPGRSMSTLLRIYTAFFFLCWVVTFVHTTDRANWFLENTLTVVVLLVLGLGHRKFQFSHLSYTFFFVYALLHIYGAEYTYAENPLGYWLKDTLHLARNHYDRIVHFSFGFLLAYPLRDYFRNHFGWPAWVCWTLPVEITLSFSAAYELLEWAVADLFFPAQGMAYLGTQGDVWDAQKDTGLAFGGALLIMLLTALCKRVFR
jgi:putative membrane protein